MLASLALASSLWLAASEVELSRDMSPTGSVSDRLDACHGDSVFSGQGSSASLTGADSNDVRVSQFGVPRLDSGREAMPTLSHHVGIVVGVGSDLEMSWIAAPSVRKVSDAVADVARMQNVAINSGDSMRQDPSESVCSHCFPSDGYRAVALVHDVAKPQPAIIWSASVYFVPEALKRSGYFGLSGAFVGTKGLDAAEMFERNPALAANRGRLSSSHDDLLGVEWSGTRQGSKPSRAPDHTLLMAALEVAREDVPPPVVVVPVEKFADRTARDFYWVLGSYSGDLYFTAIALHRCGTCYEANPLGPTAEARIALKMAGMASTGLTLFKLRRAGHGRAATVLRWSYVAVNVALAANNARHAIRKR